MDVVTSHNEETLRAELTQARGRLDSLIEDLRVIDAELDGLATERERHRLLEAVCAGLEELRERGGAGLFWGTDAAEGTGDEHVRRARVRLDAFQKQLSEIEATRAAVIEEIDQAQENAEFLEEDVLQAQREEEQRKLEWLVEREIGDLPVRPSVMPWARVGEDDKRFRKSLAASLGVGLLLGLLIPLIDLPLPEPWQATEVPDRWTSLIREELPPPPPPAPREEKPVEELPEEPEVAEKGGGEPKLPEKTAASKGILAFREKLSEFARDRDAERLGAQARISTAGEAASGWPERSMVATRGSSSSGGINLASLSRDIGGGGGGQIEGVGIARASSSIGGSGKSDRPRSDGPGLGRTDEEIQIVFDRQKAALYRLYNRELRRDPTLKGQMVLRIRIEPDGSVSLCELQTTDMDAPKLALQVVARVKTFDFGAKDGIPAITILYPIDFLPAT